MASIAENKRRLAALRADPVAFRRALLIDTDAGPRPCEAALDDWQRADFTALDPGWRRVAGVHRLAKPPILRGYLERPRGHSKTNDLAVMVAWALFASARQISGVAAAADQDQARLLRDAIAKLSNLNPWLGKCLDVQNYRVVRKETQSTLTIISADAPSSFGLTPDFLILEELTHWPKRDLWDSLISAAAKRAACMVCIIANAGFTESWQWSTRETIRSDPAWYFSRLDGPCASWIGEKALAEQRRLLPPIAYARLWGNEWSAGAGDALRPDDIAAAARALPGPSGREQGYVYVAGVDLALRRHASALCVLGRNVGWTEQFPPEEVPLPHGTLGLMIRQGIVNRPRLTSEPKYVYHSGSGRIKLCDLKVWVPSGAAAKVSPDEVEAAIIAAHERFGLAAVALDPYQAEQIGEHLRKRGIRVELADQTISLLPKVASDVVETFTDRLIDLYPSAPFLVNDLRALRIAESIRGRCRLVSPEYAPDCSPHGDTVSALGLALHFIRQYTRAPASNRIEGPLIVWP